MKLTIMNARIGVATMRQLYTATDPAMQRMYERPDVTCLPGCAACCNLLNLVTMPEALALADEIVRTRTTLEVHELIDRVDLRIEEAYPAPTDAFTLSAHYDKRIPCVLLGADNRCSTYASRPAACRYHFVVSDPALCAGDGKATVKWLDLEPYKKQVYAAAGATPVPGAFAPLEVLLWWGLILFAKGGKAFGEAYENPLYAGRRFEPWVVWAQKQLRAALTTEGTPPNAP